MPGVVVHRCFPESGGNLHETLATRWLNPSVSSVSAPTVSRSQSVRRGSPERKHRPTPGDAVWICVTPHASRESCGTQCVLPQARSPAKAICWAPDRWTNLGASARLARSPRLCHFLVRAGHLSFRTCVRPSRQRLISACMSFQLARTAKEVLLRRFSCTPCSVSFRVLCPNSCFCFARQRSPLRKSCRS